MKIKTFIQWRLPYIIVTALAMMWLTPWGSFDPTQLGFYRAILFAWAMELILYKFIKLPNGREE